MIMEPDLTLEQKKSISQKPREVRSFYVNTSQEEYSKETPKTKERKTVYEFADEIYVFCPDSNIGIMFYDQSPIGSIEKLVGSLPEGEFYGCGFKIVNWDNTINGTEKDEIEVTDNISILVNTHKQMALRSSQYGGGSGSYAVKTIIVSPNNFEKIITKIKEGEPVYQGNHLIDFNSLIVSKKLSEEYNKNKEEIKKTL